MIDIFDCWLYHFTHVDNLPSITTDGLVADGCDPPMVVECADRGIKQRRRRLRVPIGTGGVVADYVPFYFAPRSPMLYRINCGGVHSYGHSQYQLIYLVTRASRIKALDLAWAATDRNAAVQPSRFINEIDQLHTHIDWNVMEAKNWANTSDDGSRMQRRMAEFLVHRRVPWDAVTHIATCSDTVETQVRPLIASRPHAPGMVVRPGWYF